MIQGKVDKDLSALPKLKMKIPGRRRQWQLEGLKGL